jgi:hypothetical protein
MPYWFHPADGVGFARMVVRMRFMDSSRSMHSSAGSVGGTFHELGAGRLLIRIVADPGSRPEKKVKRHPDQ